MKLPPLKAIRQNCIECSGGNRAEADRCAIVKCPLHPFRFGTNPYRTVRVLSGEQREAASARLKAARGKSTNTDSQKLPA